MPGKVLVICYSFPPHPGIGGRRWAKFAKYLAKKNYSVEVFNAKNLHAQESAWTQDVADRSIHINSIEFSHQRTMQHPDLLGKFKRKWLLWSSRFTKYTPHILASYPNTHFWKAVAEKIKQEDIHTVIVSGDPYLFYYATFLKETCDIKLVLDYRDLWNDHSFYGRYMPFSAKQKAFFEEAENHAINHCDHIICVDDYIKSLVQKRLLNSHAPVSVIHNGFDRDDMPQQEGTQLSGREAPYQLVFAGSIASDLNGLVLGFLNAFSSLKKQDRRLYGQFRISISGNIDRSVIEAAESLQLENLDIRSGLSGKDAYYQAIQKADVGMVILSEECAHSFITKFSDYICLDKYMLCIGSKGHFSEFIEANGIGMLYEPQMGIDFFKALETALSKPVQQTFSGKPAFDLEHLTEQLISVIADDRKPSAL